MITSDEKVKGCQCDGTGWIVYDDAEGRGFARRCPACASAVVARQFGGKRMTWDTWLPRPELEAQVRQLRLWRPGQEWCAVLHDLADGRGNCGSGKTHALQAVAHEWARSAVSVIYRPVPRLLARIRDAIAGDESYSGAVEYYALFDGLLVLDDLGAEKTTEWAEETLESVADTRYRLHLPTAIATNLTVAEMDRRYHRLTDRCHEGLMLPWRATSMRRGEGR